MTARRYWKPNPPPFPGAFYLEGELGAEPKVLGGVWRGGDRAWRGQVAAATGVLGPFDDEDQARAAVVAALASPSRLH